MILLVGTLATTAPTPASAATPDPIPVAAPEGRSLSAGWSDYKARHVTPDGRVVDDANGGVSHSEGQGFGMLLAVGAGDQDTFGRLWNWTARELYRRPDGLAFWRWIPDAVPHVTDPNNATDGDILIAWALLRAAKVWNNPEYRAASRRIALAVGQHAIFQSRLGPALKPAVVGFDASDRADGPVVNLSYWVFPALADLPEVVAEVDWRGVTRTGLALLAAARFGPASLPSDWISLAGDPAPAKGVPPVFSYDAVRIPLYLAWSGLGTPGTYGPFLHIVRHDAAPAIIDVETGFPGARFGEPGYSAVFRVAACAAGATAAAAAPPAATEGEHYYPASLRLLANLAAQERGLTCD